MSKKKNKKNEIAKRRARAKLKKQRKHKMNISKSAQDDDFPIHERPSLPDFNVPDGFYAVTASQAMMKYSEPILEMADDGDPKSLNGAMNFAMVLWNYQIATENGKQENDSIKDDVLKIIKKSFGINSNQANEYLQKMTERKNYLFPPDIQPKAQMTMYMRKEVSHLVAEFNYGKLDLSSNPIPPDREDKKMVTMINQMDQYVITENDYDEWENNYLSMEKECAKRFNHWLISKGLDNYSNEFPFYLEVYLNFIYRYNHDDFVILKSVPHIYFEEFLCDHLLRKVMVEPHEYALWPSAMKLFYRFLYEKDYLDNSESLINQISEMEPCFIEILRKRFG